MKQADLEAFGYTPGCKRCQSILTYGSAQGSMPHSDACRLRIIEELKKMPAGLKRVEKMLERTDRFYAEEIEKNSARPEVQGGLKLLPMLCPRASPPQVRSPHPLLSRLLRLCQMCPLLPRTQSTVLYGPYPNSLQDLHREFYHARLTLARTCTRETRLINSRRTCQASPAVSQTRRWTSTCLGTCQALPCLGTCQASPAVSRTRRWTLTCLRR